MRAKEFIIEYAPPANIKFKEPEEQLDVMIKGMMDEGLPIAHAREVALDWIMKNNPKFSNDMAMSAINESFKRIEEGSKKNANVLVGSGRADPDGKKTKSDSKAHKKVRTPNTNYSKGDHNNPKGVKPGANDGFVGG